MRVVSLVPSASETLVAWGRAPVAVTRFCDQPGIATVGGTKNPDLAAIARLAPDLVVMDEEENRREDHAALVERGVCVLALAVRGLEDLEGEMVRLARAVDATWRPLRLGPPAAPARRAAVAIWRRPWRFLGPDTYGASLLAHLGLAVVPRGRGRYPQVDPAELAGEAPDLVLAPDEPYPFAERHRAALEALAPAVFVDGRDLFWWGERTRGALARLEESLGT
jgi:ABC-type Fe3+-hydroxamate transport system substrate-binding protein